MANTIISVEHISKEFQLGVIGSTTLKRELQSKIARLRGKEDPNTLIGTDQRLIGTTFMALNGLSLAMALL